jgi:hypothetical protein
VSPEELLEELVGLAEEVGLRIRRIRGAPAGDGETAVASGVVRVRGEVWVVLSEADSLEERVSTVAAALGREASARLEGRYLTPVLRDRIQREIDAPTRPPLAWRGGLP